MSGRDVWVGYEDATALVNARRAKVVGTAAVTPGEEGALFAGRGGVWVRQPRRSSSDADGTAPGTFLQWVDGATLEVAARMNVPELSGGDVVEAFGSVWASAYDDAVVYRLPLP